ncbi:uncharacterized protein NDAI_0K01540 [Naumovozyma dairenensis CBS 421]|uniref:NAD(P)-binding domain-containing protein n=1 Tax=Naumovozyma dairenensis (strain ATCC 10597 / BCRC 20456 / CBS 421 / NBRC 0211 / NRRL Y-12639) TaxID=1071378 RepID=G0WHT4_NAUDC|nr:hypothetical protein NDAI_0K01540 [Naumovozyma dairenensis CBS 421]CCD27345.1 hypothetical protein NDAI_0K01540 [Naumovozyma dairenensis CBS 421]
METLKVAIFGANGKTGRLLIDKILKELQKREGDHVWQHPIGIVRNEEQKVQLSQELDIECAVIDLETFTVKQISTILEDLGVNAVVFAAGAGARGGIAELFTVDLDGCAKVVESCEIVDIERFIHISAMNIEDREFWWSLEGLKCYFIAKRSADHFVKESKLNFTILQPGFLLVGAGTGKVLPYDRLDERKVEGYTIQREDLASIIVQCLLHPKQTSRKTIGIANGDQTIKDFIGSL